MEFKAAALGAGASGATWSARGVTIGAPDVPAAAAVVRALCDAYRVPAPPPGEDPVEHAARVLRVHVEIGEWLGDVEYY